MNDKLKKVLVQHCTIGDENSGQRIDNYLLATLKKIPKSRIYRMIRSGEVRVNGARIKAFCKLQRGDVVRIPPVFGLDEQKHKSLPKRLLHSYALPVVYEDDDFLAVNKPAGLAVHAGSGVAFGLIELLRQQRGSAVYLDLVHRLDRQTSGLLLVAKKRSALKGLQQQLQEKTNKKSYLTLVQGCWPAKLNKIEAALDTRNRCHGERTVCVSQLGKEAVTTFQLLETVANCSLLQANLLTGRTHQIRVHCQYAGYPLLGDSKYGDKQANLQAAQYGLKRLFLHAAKLKFFHPRTGAALLLEAPLPDDLQHFLEALRDGA